MSSIIKFFLDLSQAIKSFVVFYLSKFKLARKIEKQKDLDKKMVARLGGRKLPNWKQFKRLFMALNRQESVIIKILFLVVILAGSFLFYNSYYKNLVSVPKNGGDINEGLIGAPAYINPLLAFSDVDKDLSRLIFSGLMKYNEKLEPVADLAERYEISEDQKEYTFYLRPDVKWHDDKELTASDVIFTVASIQNPEFKSPIYRSFNGITAEKIDDYTIKFTLQQPYAAFLNIMTVGILPQHIWYDTSTATAKLAIYNLRPVGSGPYKFKKLVKDKTGLIKSLALEKNKNYYDKIPYINNIYFKFYPDYESAVEGLNNKEVRNLNFSPKELLKKISKRDVTLKNFDLAKATALFFNSKNNEQLADKNIREALAYAIDKNKILEDVLQNQGDIIDAPILKNYLGYNPDIKKYEYNPQKALEILTNDGWVIDQDLLKKKDTELKITLTTIDKVENVSVANLIKDFWTSIGVNVELQFIPKDKIETDIIVPRNYQVLLYSEIIGYDPDLFAFWHSSQREAPGLNLSNYGNRNVDQLLEEGRLTNDKSIREQKYLEFQNLLIEDLPAIFLYSPTYTYPVYKKIQGMNVEKIALPSDRFINIENWYMKTKKQFFK